jgi:hypothetical protein
MRGYGDYEEFLMSGNDKQVTIYTSTNEPAASSHIIYNITPLVLYK